jgi:putative hydrolase of the HAD superfamily
MIQVKSDFKVIGFDADDTLWVNEPYYRETEDAFCDLLSDFQAPEAISRELFRTEIQNLELYGFGIKAFVLSLVETALSVSEYKVAPATIQEIIRLGKAQLNKPVEILKGVRTVLEELCRLDYTLVVATKGDLLDQERKLRKSNLEPYFHHIEIMSDKKEPDYLKLLKHLEIRPEEFLMVGNSMKSDIYPVLNIGGYAIHIPFHITWQHEEIQDGEMDHDHFQMVEHISLVPELLSNGVNHIP